MNQAGDEISGTFKQGVGATPMIFKRVAEAPKLNRPQDPKKPYPYDEQEVSYRNEKDNIKISGTLTLPRGGGPYPAVLLITGSGSQDRNETIAGHRPFLVLADHLTRNGIAVLRVDDRGMGGTDIGSLSATSENFAEDVLAGVNFLKQRKEIDPKMIGLIGHSEGGMIAPMVAARSNDVAFIVLLAGPGQRGEDIIYTQTELIHKAQGTPPETLAHIIALSQKINAIVKTETDEKRIEQRINEEIAAYGGTLSDLQKKQFEPAAAASQSIHSDVQDALVSLLHNVRSASGIEERKSSRSRSQWRARLTSRLEGKSRLDCGRSQGRKQGRNNKVVSEPQPPVPNERNWSTFRIQSD